MLEVFCILSKEEIQKKMDKKMKKARKKAKCVFLIFTTNKVSWVGCTVLRKTVASLKKYLFHYQLLLKLTDFVECL